MPTNASRSITNYLRSRFGAKEWSVALAQDPDGRMRKIIPVRVRDFEAEGLLLTIVYIDLIGLGQSEAKSRLLAQLKDRLKPATQTTFPGKTAPSMGASTKAVAFPGNTSTSSSTTIRGANPSREHVQANYKDLDISSLKLDDLHASANLSA
jgi:hypothetical protein